MDIKKYIDATYLKTAQQSGISEHENLLVVSKFIVQAIQFNFKLVMIRPEYVSHAKMLIDKYKSVVSVGTVIDFPLGSSDVSLKLLEAETAIQNGADELDFVCNYQAFKNGQFALVKEEVLACTQLVLSHNKTIKWIIESAALSDKEIIQMATLIKNVVIANFKEDLYHSVFVKSSTGFFVTPNDVPNGATTHSIMLMLENAYPLPIKASGGVKSIKDISEFLRLGVKRIGTSNAVAIIQESVTESDY